MPRSSDFIREFARQIINIRAPKFDDDAHCECWLSLGAALDNIGAALRDIYDEVHALRIEIKKIKGRGPLGK